MGVPAHDERALAFARRFGLPVIAVAGPAGQQDPVGSAIAWLEESGHGVPRRTYRLPDWLFSRQRYWGGPLPILSRSGRLPARLPVEGLPVSRPPHPASRPAA